MIRIVAVLLLAACGASEPRVSQEPAQDSTLPAQDSALPAIRGFWCFKMSRHADFATYTSGCVRSRKSCDSLIAQARDKGLHATECEPTDGAHCFRSMSLDTMTEQPYCYLERTHCRIQLELYIREEESGRQYSPCQWTVSRTPPDDSVRIGRASRWDPTSR